MDYEVQRCTRHCAISGRELAPNETYYSLLLAEGSNVKRYDYAVDCWDGPPEGALGWWKSQMPGEKPRAQWAPNDVMLHVFDQLENQPDKEDMRYVLALFLVRRRVMRLEENETDAQGREQIVVYCPRREATYHVPVADLTEARAEAIQDELARLLLRQ